MLIDPYTWHKVTILRKIIEAPDAVTIVTSRPKAFEFSPGQHAIMRVPIAPHQKVLRQYSFSHRPDHNELHFTLTRSPGGAASNWLIDHARMDTVLDISQAFTGPLVLDPVPNTKIGFIAGGSGIGPIMSHVRTLRASQPQTDFSLLYSTRRSTQCFTHELMSHSANESITVVLTDEAPRASKNDVVQAIKGSDILLICGSRPFVTTMVGICKESFPDAQIYAESFSLS